MSGRTVRILVPSLRRNDAVGNDALQMQQALVAGGFEVEIVADGIEPALEDMARPLRSIPKRRWQSPDDILIYQHACGWPQGEEILFSSRNRVVFRTHNVTPASFFTRYSMAYADASESGVECARRAAARSDFVLLGDSRRNCRDLMAMGALAGNCRIVPPLHVTEELGRAPFDSAVVDSLKSGTNILFVGGIKPNKGHMRAIRAFADYYHRYNAHARLIFAGRMDKGLRLYHDALRRLAAMLRVSDAIVFTGEVSSSQLKSYYVCSDVLFCASEHEGFCVPLIEAMYFRVPIVAAPEEGVTETLGDCGVLLKEWDESVAAAEIAVLLDDPVRAQGMGADGRAAYFARYRQELLLERTCEVVREAAGEGVRGAIAS